MPEESRSTVRSVERALDILEVLERSDGPIRLVDLCRATGLHAATALRLLTPLQLRGLVVSENQTYQLGAPVLRLAHGYLVTDPLSQFARPVMQRLTAETSLTSSLHVLDGLERILAVRVDGAKQLDYQAPIGRWLPLHIGSGKAIAAYLPEEKQDEVIASAAGDVFADGTPLTAEALRTDLASIRERGFHLSLTERDLAVVAAAVPITTPDGRITGALSLSGPAYSMAREDLESTLPRLRAAGEHISHRRSYG